VKENALPHVNVVEASAGSGKTYELARRYIRLLLTAPSPGLQARAILAITFTNKASIEMKERILELLKKLALGGFRDPKEKAALLAFLGLGEEEARNAAYAALDSLIRNYNFFQVQTIDSFINAMLSGCAFRLDLSADFRIKTDNSRHIAFGLDELIEKAGHDEEILRMFLDFLRQYIFLENRAGWFPKRELLAVISQLFLDSNAYAGDVVTYPAGRGELYDKRAAVVALMKRLRDTEPAGANQVVFKSFRQRMEKYADHLDIGELARPFCAEELPLRKNQEASLESRRLWARIRAGIGELFEMEALSIFNCYVGIFTQVYTEVRRKASEENIMFLPELNRKARLLFESGMTVPELYYRLATRFRHYLIDEFQDTSVLQWKNLYLMLEEALSTGGSFFYVGDKKQAIFRFRGGDASLFHSVAKDFEQFSVKVDYLTRNYRSSQEIVEFNNAVFSAENLRRFLAGRQEAEGAKDAAVVLSDDDTRDIIGIFDGSAQVSAPGAGGCVRILSLEAGQGEDEEEIIRGRLVSLLADIQQRRKSFRGVAVLSRANTDIEKMTGWLLEAGIPVESEKTLNVREHPLIKEIVSLLGFLTSPIDDLAFASFILGDIFAAASGIRKDEIEHFLFERQKRGKKEAVSYLYREFRDTYPGKWEELIDEFFRNIGFVPLYELVVSIYATLRICANFPAYQGFLMKFLELVRVQVKEENADCAAFLEYFAAASDEELYVNVAGTDAVKLLSIHKAKGLGFDVVIIPFLEISIDVGAGAGRPYLIDAEGDDGIRLIKINRTNLAFSERLTRIYTAEYKRLLIDELNAVYVALTRAKTELYAFLPAKSGRSLNYCRLLVPEQLYESGTAPEQPAMEQEKAGKRLLLEPSAYRSWIPYLKEEFISKTEVQNRVRILDGTVMHRALFFIGDLRLTDPEAAVRDAVERCRCEFPLYDGFDRVGNKLSAMLSDTRLRRFFYPGEGAVACEKEIADRTGAVKRIDRVISSAAAVTIVDYKSSKKERESGREQLAGYRALAEETYGKPCAAFLLYLDEMELEEIHGKS
jgi:ATP-dependent helicase/nuclease subunit A